MLAPSYVCVCWYFSVTHFCSLRFVIGASGSKKRRIGARGPCAARARFQRRPPPEQATYDRGMDGCQGLPKEHPWSLIWEKSGKPPRVPRPLRWEALNLSRELGIPRVEAQRRVAARVEALGGRSNCCRCPNRAPCPPSPSDSVSDWVIGVTCIASPSSSPSRLG